MFCFHDYEKCGEAYTSEVVNKYGIKLLYSVIDGWVTKNEICLKCGKVKDNISKIKKQEANFYRDCEINKYRQEKAKIILDKQT